MNCPFVRPELDPLPERMAALEADHRGYPVPWFVEWIDDKPDFRVIGVGKIALAVNHKLCWVCGQKLGVYLAFVLGPMCCINRTISEPPSHLECARWSARNCPFLARPHMVRRENDLPGEIINAPGFGLKRNPGVMCVWVTKVFIPFRVDQGILFTVGDPESIEWYAEGRPATRAEVMASVESGLPSLEELAVKQGTAAVKELRRFQERAASIWPKE